MCTRKSAQTINKTCAGCLSGVYHVDGVWYQGYANVFAVVSQRISARDSHFVGVVDSHLFGHAIRARLLIK